jgi:GPI mannosyltransferase 4
MLASACICVIVMVAGDAWFYFGSPFGFMPNITRIITPWNNWSYNSQAQNLALHGVHPRWLNLLVNLPILVGPALALVNWRSPLFQASLVGTLLLSGFPHQEIRFVLPTVPLILTSVQFPRFAKHRHMFLALWMFYNATLALFMGAYHQASVFPAQLLIADLGEVEGIYWWQTLDPPFWILGGQGHDTASRTTVFRGSPMDLVVSRIEKRLDEQCNVCDNDCAPAYLVTPLSNRYLPYLRSNETPLHIAQEWTYNMHITLDDMDFDHGGVAGELFRIVKERGLGVFRVTKACKEY